MSLEVAGGSAVSAPEEVPVMPSRTDPLLFRPEVPSVVKGAARPVVARTACLSFIS